MATMANSNSCRRIRRAIGQSAQEMVDFRIVDLALSNANRSIGCVTFMISQSGRNSGGVAALRTQGRSRVAAEDIGRWTGGIARINSIPIWVMSRSVSRMTALGQGDSELLLNPAPVLGYSRRSRSGLTANSFTMLVADIPI